MDKLLLIDIGGTHMRHAIASANSNKLTEINKELFSTKNFDKILQFHFQLQEQHPSQSQALRKVYYH